MRILGVAVLPVAALLLAGCVSAREVPEPVSDAELQSYLEDRVDAAWQNTGLEGIVERPQIDPSTYVENYRGADNYQAMSECIGSAGTEVWSVTEANGGPVFTTGTGALPPTDELLALYTCYAANPTDFGGMLLSRAESDYLYDYYQEWVIPCVELRGYSMFAVPSRAEFASGLGYGWIPYYNLEPGLLGEDPYGDTVDPGFFIELADACGDPFPGLPYGERYGF